MWNGRYGERRQGPEEGRGKGETSYGNYSKRKPSLKINRGGNTDTIERVAVLKKAIESIAPRSWSSGLFLLIFPAVPEDNDTVNYREI